MLKNTGRILFFKKFFNCFSFTLASRLDIRFDMVCFSPYKVNVNVSKPIFA